MVAPSYKKGSFDSHAVDGPFLFFHKGKYWMTYLGWDGEGYQTGLASSDDLMSWNKEGIMLGRGPRGTMTEYNAALTSILRENELHGPASLKRVKGRYIGTYHAYPEPGYESGPAVIGLCFSKDLRFWEVGEPVLEPDESWSWESGGLYKSWLMEDGGSYYLFYNAKNKREKSTPWIEETGVAISTDLETWHRHSDNPLLTVGLQGEFDDKFASDPCVLRHDGSWVMFYHGNCTDGHARDGVAFSEDLIHWKKGNSVLIDVGPAGTIDSKYAHKPGIITRDGTLYHFYCAVAPAGDMRLGEITHSEVRGITLATS